MLPRVACAAILAGGLSSRMGREKALLLFEGEPLVVRAVRTLRPLFDRVVIITANAEVTAVAGVPALADQYTGRGPLGGIHTALAHFGAPTFVVACDMPFLNPAFIEHQCARFFEESSPPDALVPRGPNGSEPLHAIYSPRCIPVFESLLRAESGAKMPSLRFVLGQVNTFFLPETVAQDYGVSFENWNTPDDIRE